MQESAPPVAAPSTAHLFLALDSDGPFGAGSNVTGNVVLHMNGEGTYKQLSLVWEGTHSIVPSSVCLLLSELLSKVFFSSFYNIIFSFDSNFLIFWLL
jgi:hypothetical protein